MEQELQELVDMLTAMLDGDEEALSQFGDAPTDTVEAAVSGASDDVDPEALLRQALEQSNLDGDAQAEVLAALQGAAEPYGEPEGGYDATQLADIFAQSVNATLEEGDYINVDNSLYAEAGEGDGYHEGGVIKGGIDQYNTTNITDADDGAVVAEYADNSNFQTGSDNVQATDVWADNITTGDGNTVASEGSVIGDGNVHAGSIYDAEFGDGNKDDSLDVDVKVEDSLNEDHYKQVDYSDDDYTDTTVDIDVKEHGHGHGYEEIVEEVAYEADGHEGLDQVADYLEG